MQTTARPSMRPRRCVFCGRTPLSREHFWSEWMHPLLPKIDSPEHGEVQMVHEGKTELVDVPRNVFRQGGTWTKTFRIVCRRCNSEWMSGVETEAKPVLVPVISGETLRLTDSDRQKMARWVALKVLLLDANEPRDTVSSVEERRAFMIDRVLPWYLHLWIGRINGSAWSSRLHRHAAILVRNQHPLPTPPAVGKTIQCITFGAGGLLVYAVLDKSAIGFGVLPRFENKMPRLWPLSPTDLHWPPQMAVTDVEVHMMVEAMGKLVRSDRVRWLPKPETR